MPRKHNTQTRRRSRGHAIRCAATTLVRLYSYVQNAGSTWREWSYRMVSLKQAQQLVLCGEAEAISRLVEGEVQIVGYRGTKPIRQERPSPTCLLFATSNAVAKHALGHDELNRAEQRHVEKFVAWPWVGDDKAVAVRPRVSVADAKVAQGMFRAGQLQVKRAA